MKRTFIVEMTCTVKKSVVVEAESAEEAEAHPWENATDEVELEMTDWEVDKVMCQG